MSGQKKISQLPSLTASTNGSLIAVVFSGASGNTTYQMTIQDFVKSTPFGTVYQNIIPNVSDTYSLGTSARTFSSIYVGAGTVFIGPNNSLGINDDGVLFSTNVFAAPTFQVGNVTSDLGVVTTSGYTFSVLNQELIARKNSGGTVYNITRQLVPTGGTTNQVLVQTGSTSYSFGWANVPQVVVPRIISGITTAFTINFSSDTTIHLHTNAATVTATLTGYTAGKQVDVIVYNNIGGTQQYNHGLPTSNNAVGGTSFYLSTHPTMWITYICEDNTAGNCFVKAAV
jgi:hypothetical protein